MVFLFWANAEVVLKKNNLLLLFFVLVGAVLGGIIGEVFGSYVGFLNYGESIGFKPVTVNLSIIQLTLGFSMRLTLSGIIGLLLGILLFKKIA